MTACLVLAVTAPAAVLGVIRIAAAARAAEHTTSQPPAPTGETR